MGDHQVSFLLCKFNNLPLQDYHGKVTIEVVMAGLGIIFVCCLTSTWTITWLATYINRIFAPANHHIATFYPCKPLYLKLVIGPETISNYNTF